MEPPAKYLQMYSNNEKARMNKLVKLGMNINRAGTISVSVLDFSVAKATLESLLSSEDVVM